MSHTPEEPSQPKRIVSIDQLRGYAIFGMLLVNAKEVFFTPIKATLAGSSMQGFFNACLDQITHHRPTFSYADTIAPLFVFVVGMGMRLSWLRRSEAVGVGPARKALLKRYVLLVLIAFAIYAGWLWDALMDIGLAGILAILLIDKKPKVRLIAAFVFVFLFQAIHSLTSYGTWSLHGRFSLSDPHYVPLLVRLIPLHEALFGCTLNGGPLGPMGWVMMLLFGSYAYDVMAERNDGKFILMCVGWGVGLCALAFACYYPWGSIKEKWLFSARYMTAPFPLWSTGLCFFQLLAFYLICDKLNWRIPTFTSVGMNPLVIYIAQCLILDVAEGFAPKRLPMAAGFLGFAVFWGLFACSAYYMRKRKIYIKL